MGDQLGAPSALSPRKGPSLPTGQGAIDIVVGVLNGAFGHPHVSERAYLGVRVKSKLL